MMRRTSLLAVKVQTHAPLCSLSCLDQGFDDSFYILTSHFPHPSVQFRQVEMLLPVSHLHNRLCLWK